MFEKEAEEEINKEHWKYSIFKDLAQEYWQKGAEFGYNKANEWHYPSKGEYPREEDEYLVIFESDGTKYKGLESYYPDTKEWSTVCKIIAWKEIVLPKESE